MLTPSGLAIGRLASQQCLAHLRTSLPLSIRRVAVLYSLSTPTVRQYADKPVSRPKAHTGRSTSTRKPRAAAKPKDPPATATSSIVKPKTRGTASAKPKAKPKPKPKSKAKRKTKPKAKPKKSTRKPLTDVQKTAAAAKKSNTEIRTLKAQLLTPPHRLPFTAFQILLSERSKANKERGSNAAKVASGQYKSLSTEQREVRTCFGPVLQEVTHESNLHKHYNHLANENKANNETQYRRWIESHTPAQIHESNRVRALLIKRTSKAEKAGSRKTRVPVKLQDDREVKQCKTSYIYFHTERFKSGDFKGIIAPEAARRIGREWKELSAAEKKVSKSGDTMILLRVILIHRVALL